MNKKNVKNTSNKEKMNIKTNQNRKDNLKINSNKSKNYVSKKELDKNKQETLKKEVQDREINDDIFNDKKMVKEFDEDEKEKVLEKTLIFDGNQSKNIEEVVNKLEEDNIVLKDKIIKRSKVRKVIIVILVIIMLVLICGTIKYVIDYDANEKNNNQTINSNIYEKVSNNIGNIVQSETKNSGNVKDDSESEEIKYSNIQTISLNEFENKVINGEDMTVLIASSKCYYSLTFEPIINEVFAENEKTIYRIDILNLSKEEITRFRSYYAFKATPTIFSLKNGIAVSELKGTATKENLDDWVKNYVS